MLQEKQPRQKYEDSDADKAKYRKQHTHKGHKMQKGKAIDKRTENW